MPEATQDLILQLVGESASMEAAISAAAKKIAGFEAQTKSFADGIKQSASSMDSQLSRSATQAGHFATQVSRSVTNLAADFTNMAQGGDTGIKGILSGLSSVANTAAMALSRVHPIAGAIVAAVPALVEIGSAITDMVTKPTEEALEAWRELKRTYESTAEEWKKANTLLVTLGFATKDAAKEAEKHGKIIRLMNADGKEMVFKTEDLVKKGEDYNLTIVKALNNYKLLLREKEKDLRFSEEMSDIALRHPEWKSSNWESVARTLRLTAEVYALRTKTAGIEKVIAEVNEESNKELTKRTKEEAEADERRAKAAARKAAEDERSRVAALDEAEIKGNTLRDAELLIRLEEGARKSRIAAVKIDLAALASSAEGLSDIVSLEGIGLDIVKKMADGAKEYAEAIWGGKKAQTEHLKVLNEVVAAVGEVSDKTAELAVLADKVTNVMADAALKIPAYLAGFSKEEMKIVKEAYESVAKLRLSDLAKVAAVESKGVFDTYFINPFAQALYSKVKAAGEAITSWLKSAFGTVLEYLGSLAETIFGKFMDLAKLAGATLPEAEAIEKAAKEARTAAIESALAGGATPEEAQAAGEEAAVAAAKGAKGTGFEGQLQGVLGGITGEEGMLANLAANIGPLLDQLTRWIPQFVEQIAKQVPVIVEAFAANLEPLVLSLIDAVPKLIDAIVENLPTLLDALIEALPTIIQKLVETLVPALIELLLWDLPKLAVEFAINLIAQLPKIIVGIFTAIGNMIKGWLRSTFPRLARWIFGEEEGETTTTPVPPPESVWNGEGAVPAGYGEFPVAHWGGLVTAAGVMSYAIGGFVSSLNATSRRMREVPILAKPGEGVLTGRGVAAIGGAPGLAAANAGMGGGGVTVDLRGAFIGARDVGSVVDDMLGQRLKRRIGSVSRQIRGKRQFNVRGISKMP